MTTRGMSPCLTSGSVPSFSCGLVFSSLGLQTWDERELSHRNPAVWPQFWINGNPASSNKNISLCHSYENPFLICRAEKPSPAKYYQNNWLSQYAVLFVSCYILSHPLRVTLLWMWCYKPTSHRKHCPLLGFLDNMGHPSLWWQLMWPFVRVKVNHR